MTPAGTYYQPELPRLSFFTPAGHLPRGNASALRRPLYGLHQGQLLPGWSGALGLLSRTACRTRANGLFGQAARCPRRLADRQRRLQHPARLRLVHRAVGRRRVVARRSRSAQRCRACADCRPFVLRAGHRDDRRYREPSRSRSASRVGTNFTSRGVAWQPFFTASVFHEFAGDVHRARSVACRNTGKRRPSTACGSRRRRAASAPMASSRSARPPRSSIPAGSAMPASTTGSARISTAGASTPACATSSRPSSGAAASRTRRPPPWYAYNWTGPYIGGFVGTDLGRRGLVHAA